MNQYENVRSQLVDYLQRDQFGPYGGNNELLPENPLRRYMVGILHPQGTSFDEAADDGGPGREPGTLNDDSEPSLRMSNTLAPSSYGLTFACKKEIDSIRLFIRAGSYDPIEVSEGEPPTPVEKWQRRDTEDSFTLNMKNPRDETFKVITDKLSIRARVREVDQSDTRSITISVVNEQKCKVSSPQGERAGKSFFQVFFGAEAIDNNRPFVTRNPISTDSSVSEDNSLRLLYRKVNVFATGHGCATDWDEAKDRSGINDCNKVFSSFVPRHTVSPMVQPDDLNLPKFSVRKISESSATDLKNLFSAIPENYRIWIRDLKDEVNKLDKNLRPQAEEHIRLCQASAGRISRGINLLVENEMVYKSFILMHKAMLYQIAHSRWLKDGKPSEGPQLDEKHAWYPFQIAFILQCLESLADPGCEERTLVDLLWFPTGGGKTEAYLGIIAFLIFLRRLRSLDSGGDGGGTIALMRYTLRLLTVDQFYRAALLACSCEKVRKEGGTGLSKTAPVSIGLWVGGEASPNYSTGEEGAREALERINAGGEEPRKGNPLKVKECPWCGTEIGSADYTLPDDETPMLICCPGEECDFNDGLPVWVIDTDIYRHRPALIIGTVDKFARLPWVKEAGSIFGTDRISDPPEVIIQDELHLISGPLGTMVGLYETALDVLCTDRLGHPPKVIASTATIRNAERQTESLFCRGVRQFPPSGLTYSDSFFAREAPDKPGRKYIGVFTPGTSPTTALVRTFAILLHAAQQIKCTDEVRDAFWTLMSYFNSLRELGGASVQVDDDVNDYLQICAERDNDRTGLRQVARKAELTGRVKSTDLDEIRKDLWLRYPDDDCLDVVLATNMISVGLDVPRLGLMAVVGQPKSTSEYIQATSRIGRSNPGLVVTLYNWTRSRDRSHFERFKGYHAKLYSEVEATSVTPFSSRARDRGLHAVLISLVRHLVNGMGENSSAVKFDSQDPEVKALVKKIIDRVGAIDSQEKKDTEQALQEILRRWQVLANGGELPYKKRKRRDDRVSLMIAAEDASTSSPSFGTLNSLRNIDPAAGLKLER